MQYIYKEDLNQIELHEEKSGIQPHATLSYDEDRENFYITFVEVPSRLRGKGIGAKLLMHAMQEAAKKGLKTIPKCSFARRVMEDKGFMISNQNK